MAVKYPDILEHNNSSRALLDDNQLRGGAVIVADPATRNAYPEDKRKVGMIMTYDVTGTPTTKRYDGADTTDPNWTMEANWSDIGSGGGGNPFDQDLNTTDSPTFANLTLPQLGQLSINTGTYITSTTPNLLALVTPSGAWWSNNGTWGNNNVSGAAMTLQTASNVIANILPNVADTDTGIGRNGDNELSLISGGTETFRLYPSYSTVKNFLDTSNSAIIKSGITNGVLGSIYTTSSSADGTTLSAGNYFSGLITHSDQVIDPTNGDAYKFFGKNGLTISNSVGLLAVGSMIRSNDGNDTLPVFVPEYTLDTDSATTGYGGNQTELKLFNSGTETMRVMSDRIRLIASVKTTTGDPVTPVSGDITINEFDNAIKIYADGAWRTISTW